ncbi:MAG TPA: hypothetical protein VNN62_10765 [Methylomirabilota bacterium]|jgi:predicted ATPase|nr:hypothetical protein [Methylomirabilota bacterium]
MTFDEALDQIRALLRQRGRVTYRSLKLRYQLVEAELVYQRGLLPRARYIFKHALIQDTAYQSLLKSRRQQLHQQVARVLGRAVCRDGGDPA